MAVWVVIVNFQVAVQLCNPFFHIVNTNFGSAYEVGSWSSTGIARGIPAGSRRSGRPRRCSWCSCIDLGLVGRGVNDLQTP